MTTESRKFWLLAPNRPKWKSQWKVIGDNGQGSPEWVGNGHVAPWFQVIELKAYEELKIKVERLEKRIEKLLWLLNEVRENGCVNNGWQRQIDLALERDKNVSP